MASHIDLSSDPSFKAVGRTTGTTADLESIALPTLCPPDFPPRSRIVAVCGVTDFDNQASPTLDGWFFSDFYLFYHLLSPRVVGSSNQVWLTSEEPSFLVTKYKEYVHGDPRRDRRVVLDQDVLKRIQDAGNIRVVPRSILLERFLNTVKEQARIAADSNEHLVILLFGHGEDSTYGVAIGGECDVLDSPKLNIEDIKRVIRRDAPVTLFMTSCFSGGWLVQPNINKRQHLNVTGIAGCGHEQITRSWPVSASLSRASGSMVATAIMKSIIDIDDQQAASDIRGQPTYISLANAIHESYKKLDSMFEEQQVHFSAQDDTWAMQYQARIGIPLDRFKSIWEGLRSVPSGDYRSEPSNNRGETLRRFGTIRRDRVVKYRAWEYLSSFPGAHNNGPNVAFHNSLMMLLENKEEFSDSRMEKINNALRYRLSALDQANDLVKIMGLSMPDIRHFAVEKWNASWEQRELKGKIWRVISDKNILDRPCKAGLFYTKPMEYICIALVESKMSWEEMMERIHIAEEYTKQRTNQIMSLHRGNEIIADGEVVRTRDALLNAIRDAPHQVKQWFTRRV